MGTAVNENNSREEAIKTRIVGGHRAFYANKNIVCKVKFHLAYRGIRLKESYQQRLLILKERF